MELLNRSFYLYGDNVDIRLRPLFFVRVAGASDPLHFSSPPPPPHRPRAAKARKRGNNGVRRSFVPWSVG